MLHAGKVVLPDAPTPTSSCGALGDAETRPLLAGKDVRAEESRGCCCSAARDYARAHITVDTTGLVPSAVARADRGGARAARDEAGAPRRRARRPTARDDRSYPIFVDAEAGADERFAGELTRACPSGRNRHRHRRHGVASCTSARFADALRGRRPQGHRGGRARRRELEVARGAPRSCASRSRAKGSIAARVIVALGGGVVGDLGGFVASIFLRGVRLRAGADDAAGAGRLVGRRQDRREPAGGQEPGRRLPAAAPRLRRCRRRWRRCPSATRAGPRPRSSSTRSSPTRSCRARSSARRRAARARRAGADRRAGGALVRHQGARGRRRRARDDRPARAAQLRPHRRARARVGVARRRQSAAPRRGGRARHARGGARRPRPRAAPRSSRGSRRCSTPSGCRPISTAACRRATLAARRRRQEARRRRTSTSSSSTSRDARARCRSTPSADSRNLARGKIAMIRFVVGGRCMKRRTAPASAASALGATGCANERRCRISIVQMEAVVPATACVAVATPWPAPAWHEPRPPRCRQRHDRAATSPCPSCGTTLTHHAGRRGVEYNSIQLSGADVKLKSRAARR